MRMSKSRSAVSPGPEILLEVRPAATSGDLAPRAVVPEEFKSRAGEIADSIAEVADHFRSRLGKVLDQRDDSSWRVGSVEIQFGIAVQAEAGVVIAKATAGATFSARLVLQVSGDPPG
jgi:Trypsin-co-occurring domain 1